MRKIIVSLFMLQIFLTPTTVMALESTGRPTSDVGTSQNTTQNAGSLNNNQLSNVQTSDNRLLEQQGSTSQVLNFKADPNKRLTVQDVITPKLEVVKQKSLATNTNPTKRNISLKTILVRGLIIAALILLGAWTYNFYKTKNRLTPAPAALTTSSKKTRKSNKPKNKKKNVGHRKR